MTAVARDTSRDRRIEDLSNLYIVHPAAHALVAPTIRLGISANTVSLTGLGIGIVAAVLYYHWPNPAASLLALLLCVAWLIADGLDGMVARATGTASPLGRFLDGVCDHGVFIIIYCALAQSIGTVEAWGLAVAAGAAHAVQSSLYEAERARFHRRMRGLDDARPPNPTNNPLVAAYDSVAGSMDRMARRFDSRVQAAPDRQRLTDNYAARAVVPMRIMALLSANVRVLAIGIACLARDPSLFWWFEIGPLTALTVATVLWHRRVETITI